MQKLVMVVDDSVTIRAIADLVFRKTEFELITASSAVEALARLPSLEPEMIIIDAEMPSVDGYALAKRLKEGEKTADVPLLLMVTDAGPDPARLGDIDIDGYVIKPFTAAEILDPVRMLTGVEVRHDVPLSFEQLMASRRAAEEQRRLEMEAMADAQEKSQESELDFSMEDEVTAKPAAVRAPRMQTPIPSFTPPPPRNVASDLDLPPAPPHVTPPPVAPPPVAPPPVSPPVEVPEVKMEAPISARSHQPIADPGEPEPVEEPEQHVTSQSIEAQPPVRDKTAPPAPRVPRKADSQDIVVEHVESKVREPEVRRENLEQDTAVTIPPQLRPNRKLFAVIIALALIAVAVVVWLRS